MSTDNRDAIFKGWPQTTIDRKKKEVVIHADYLTPKRAQIRDFILTTFAIVLMAGFFISPEEIGFIIFWAFLTAYLLWISHLKVSEYLKTNVRIVFTENSIRIQMGWENEEYSRSLPHTFHIEYSEKVIKQKKKNSTEINYIYKNSYLVFMKHLGGDVFFPAMYQRKTADALFQRVLAVDEWITNYSQEHWHSK
ncbi:MAG: hypothetical protein NPINA01_32070 [Nitrospinaceae bacterium]|nr:MAG: hypothetical protein NPINA01_32070 [Nitrospinaceae bacterium]